MSIWVSETTEFGTGVLGTTAVVTNLALDFTTAHDVLTGYDFGTTITGRYFHLKFTFAPQDGNTDDASDGAEFRFSAVSEPSSAALFGLGGLALILRRRK